MTSERPSQLKAMVGMIGFAAGVVILLLGFSIRSLVAVFVKPQPSGTVQLETASQEDAWSASAKNAAKEAASHAQEAMPVAVSPPVPPAKVKKTSDFKLDNQTLRAREDARRAMIRDLRQQAREDPQSSSTMSEEQIKKLEQSNDMLR